MMPFEYFNYKYKIDGKNVNKTKLSGLVWPIAGGHDWVQREPDLEDLVVRNMMVAVDRPDSRRFGQKIDLK